MFKQLTASFLIVILFSTTVQASVGSIIVGGGCTLVDAIRAANSDAPVGGCTAGGRGRDVITLNADVMLTAPAEGVNGLPVIHSAITIHGNGHVIARSTDAGTPSFRLLEISADGDLILEAVTLRGGRLTGGTGGRGANATGDGAAGEPGKNGAWNFFMGREGGTGENGEAGKSGSAGAAGGSVRGGAILNAGTLEMRACTVEENAVAGGHGGNGGAATGGGEGGKGGLGGAGPLIILSHSSSPGGMGGIGGIGGQGGTGGVGGNASGGALYNADGSVTISGCVFSDNLATGGAGGAGGFGGSGGGGGKGGNGVQEKEIVLGPAGAGGRGGAGGTGGTGGVGAGGAISSVGGVLSVTRTQFVNNRAASGAGGLGGRGNGGGDGGLEQGDGGLGGPGGTGGVSGAAQGGAISNVEGELRITRSVFQGNVARSGNGAGGGAAGVGGSGGGFLVRLTDLGDRQGTFENIRNVLFSFFGTYGEDNGGPGGTGGDGGSSGASLGGAVYGRDGVVTVTGSTLYDGAAEPGNVGAGGKGSLSGFSNELLAELQREGINIRTPNGDGVGGQAGMTEGGGIASVRGTLLIERSTFTRNEASEGGGIAASGTGSQQLVSSTISGNQATTTGGGVSADQMTIQSSIVAGNSISGNGEPDASVSAMTGRANDIGGDPQLSALGNYGGGVPTLALVGTSPAVNHGRCNDTTDQRGYFIVDAWCDAGAYELGATPTRPTHQGNLPPPAPGDTSGAVRAGLPAGSFATVIAVDGDFVRSSGEIGNAAVIQRGVIAAVDVFTLHGTSAAGGVICFVGEGEMIFLSADEAPRIPRMVASWQTDGHTCATLPGDGTLVLVSH